MENRRDMGFTLIEMIIALAIVAMMLVLALPSINAVSGASARSAAGELAGAMRWVFDTAALRHETCRLALDIDDSSWWVECTHDRVYAERNPAHAPEPELEPEKETDARDDRDAEKHRLLKKAKFGQFTDQQVKKKKLPSGISFGDIWVEHQKDPANKGLSYIYFYAQGQTESAQLPVTDGNNLYTLVLNPILGRAKIVSGKVEIPHR